MDLKKYIYGHCVYPVSLRVFDAYSSSYVVRKVPCGKCLHCRNTRVNEWVTRLYAQALYSKYVYYITLDYAPFSYEKDVFSDDTAQLLAAETAACWNNLNKNSRYGMQPILLKKHHLQNFLKRFRKNTGLKIQYFACGEYGMHAKGRGYGRPHFHLIVYCDSPITQTMFEDAWTLNGYKIGKVDYQDLRACGAFDDNIHISDSKSVFKYVCKYLQKSDFDFEKLATINFHRSYFKSITPSMLSSEYLTGETENRIKFAWKEYCEQFSPFVVCSRKPSIGLRYYEENCERFSRGDLQLFGLSKECVAFPRYFLRKTKEAFCRFRCLGEVSQNPSSSARLGYVSALLREIQNSWFDFSSFDASTAKRWFVYREKTENGEKRFITPYFGADFKVPLSFFHFYDYKNKSMYQFNGYSYTIWHKYNKLGFVRVGELGIDEVLNNVLPEFRRVHFDFYSPMHFKQLITENDLSDTIDRLFKGDSFDDKYKLFMKEVQNIYFNELALNRKTKLLTQNSKIEL